MSIRLLIADDHSWIREGLRYAFYGTEIKIVGEAASGEEAIELALGNGCDLLLLDVKMPGHNGLEVLEAVKSKRPEMRILIYSHHGRPDFQERAHRLGASGYVLKNADRNQLIDAIRRVSRGERLWHEQWLRQE